ncbi:MAG: SPOR domain-containing protein, partial [Comamonas sp.]
MLRFALLVLLIANAGYLAWSQGWMATLGWAPETQSEPYRLKQQVRPEVLSVVPPETPRTLPAADKTAQPVVANEPVEEVLPETTV